MIMLQHLIAPALVPPGWHTSMLIVWQPKQLARAFGG